MPRIQGGQPPCALLGVLFVSLPNKTPRRAQGGCPPESSTGAVAARATARSASQQLSAGPSAIARSSVLTCRIASVSQKELMPQRVDARLPRNAMDAPLSTTPFAKISFCQLRRNTTCAFSSFLSSRFAQARTTNGAAMVTQPVAAEAPSPAKMSWMTSGNASWRAKIVSIPHAPAIVSKALR